MSYQLHICLYIYAFLSRCILYILKHLEFKVESELIDKTLKDSIRVSAARGSQREEPKEGSQREEPKEGVRLEYRVDWFQGTFNAEYLEKVRRIVSTGLGGGNFEERMFGVRHFVKSYKHPTGAVIGVGQRLKNGVVNESLGYLELSGSVLLKIRQKRLRKIMRVLRKRCKFKCTHLDLTIDDYGKSFLIKEVKRAYDEGKVIGFRDTGEHKELGRRGRKGEMMSFGKRGSAGGGKRIVFYNKSLESNGKIDSCRIELAAYRKYAQESFEQLCKLPYVCWGDVIGGWISGAIDFRDTKGENDKNPGRRKRLEWWAKLVDRFEKLKPSTIYKPDSLDKVKLWLQKQVAPSLAVLVYKMKGEKFWDYFWSLVYDGESRFKEKHWYLINSC